MDIVSLLTGANTVQLVIAIFIFIMPMLIFNFGAAKLSYDKYGSIGYSILDFIFSTFYYPYYAFFLNEPVYLQQGGKRRHH